nr:MAG TPA: hypothetical protein [Caudoviricetes sp.]
MKTVKCTSTNNIEKAYQIGRLFYFDYPFDFLTIKNNT